MGEIREILKKEKGIISYCTSHPLVLEACMEEAKKNERSVLIEATANQVNQYGGYTGMKPADYMRYVHRIADKAGLAREYLIVGGDHLGPLVWSGEPASVAMEKAKVLIREFIEAGFSKIHLDTSMRLGDDDPDRPLSVETVAERGAVLYEEAVKAFQQRKKNCPNEKFPTFIIGSEVPIPGGSQKQEETVTVTDPAAFKETVEIYQSVFKKAGFPDAFEHIAAVVVQPGVEFGEESVWEYQRSDAKALTEALKDYPGLVFEGHSTDYQKEESLRKMAEDGIKILKVGPELTYALREGLFQLEAIEKEFVYPWKQSRFSEILEEEMIEKPENWIRHYRGTEKELHLSRKYSYSDRSRYYLGEPRVEAAKNKLFRNLDEITIPDTLLHQFFPIQYQAVRQGKLVKTSEALIKDCVIQVIRRYQRAIE